MIYGLGEALRRQPAQARSPGRHGPYNTYLRRPAADPDRDAGPGVIACAAVQPADSTKALYFVARGDGSSVFSGSPGRSQSCGQPTSARALACPMSGSLHHFEGYRRRRQESSHIESSPPGCARGYAVGCDARTRRQQTAGRILRDWSCSRDGRADRSAARLRRAATTCKDASNRRFRAGPPCFVRPFHRRQLRLPGAGAAAST